jgi:hypothetical protein
MTVDERRVVDYVYLDRETSRVVLVIADHLTWEDEENHLRIVQEKLLDYIEALAGDELQMAQEHRDFAPAIEVVAKHPFPATLPRLLAVLEKYGREQGLGLLRIWARELQVGEA